MAEREGFEPSEQLPTRVLSKDVLSATQPSLPRSFVYLGDEYMYVKYHITRGATHENPNPGRLEGAKISKCREKKKGNFSWRP